LAPPAFAPIAPRTARKASDAPETIGTIALPGDTTTISNGSRGKRSLEGRESGAFVEIDDHRNLGFVVERHGDGGGALADAAAGKEELLCSTLGLVALCRHRFT
jgi:hypothetical protein